MPCYFFDVRDGRDFKDEIGTNLVDDDAARSEAICASGEMIRAFARKSFWAGEDWTMEVSEKGGRPVATLRFSGIAYPLKIDA